MPQARQRPASVHAGQLARVHSVTLWAESCPASLSGGLSRQECWRGLPYPSRHPFPRAPGAARASVTQAPAPPPHPGLTGAAPSPPGQPQEQTPVDDPHAEVGIKPEFKPRGRVAEERDRNLPSSCTSCRLDPHDQLGRLCLWVHKDTESSHRRKRTSSDSCGHWRQEHRGLGPD